MKHVLPCICLVIAFTTFSCQEMILGSEEANPPLPTQQATRARTILDSLRYALDLPALAGAIMTDTGVVDAEAVGCRRYAGPANVTSNDRFLLGSCAKSFTAVLLGVLVDGGKVQWTTTPPEIFPEYAGTMRPEYRSVNLLRLLSHGAGFIRDPDVALQSTSPRGRRTEVVAWALSQPPAVPSGQYLYSNVGFIIAGAAAEKLADGTYEDLLMARVLLPLGLTTAGFGAMGTEGMEDQPLQHTPSHGPIVATPDAHMPDIHNPAGGDLYMSVGDWARYCQWVLACEAGRPSLLSAQTARAITTPVTPHGGGAADALGWGVQYPPGAGGKVLSYLGSNGYNFAQVMLVPGLRFGVIAMTNQGGGDRSNPVGPVVNRLIQYHFNGN